MEKQTEPKTKTIHQKLFDIMGILTAPSKDSNNDYYGSKYISVRKLLDHIRPLLAAERLLLIQPIENHHVVTRIIDVDTGETVESSLELPHIQDAQKIGSAVTLFDRYTLTTLFGMHPVDDDGNATILDEDENRDASKAALDSLMKRAKRMKKTYPDSHPQIVDILVEGGFMAPDGHWLSNPKQNFQPANQLIALEKELKEAGQQL